MLNSAPATAWTRLLWAQMVLLIEWDSFEMSLGSRGWSYRTGTLLNTESFLDRRQHAHFLKTSVLQLTCMNMCFRECFSSEGDRVLNLKAAPHSQHVLSAAITAKAKSDWSGLYHLHGQPRWLARPARHDAGLSVPWWWWWVWVCVCGGGGRLLLE